MSPSTLLAGACGSGIVDSCHIQGCKRRNMQASSAPGMQVVAQLTSLDGRVAAKASRAVMLRSDWWSLGCDLGLLSVSICKSRQQLLA